MRAQHVKDNQFRPYPNIRPKSFRLNKMKKKKPLAQTTMRCVIRLNFELQYEFKTAEKKKTGGQLERLESQTMERKKKRSIDIVVSIDQTLWRECRELGESWLVFTLDFLLAFANQSLMADWNVRLFRFSFFPQQKKKKEKIVHKFWMVLC